VPFRAELAEAHEEEERLRRRRYLRYLVVIGVVNILAVGLVIWLVGDTRGTVSELKAEVDKVQATQEEIQATQEAGKVRGYLIRALQCRIVEQTGGTFEEGDPCLDEVMEPYFTPQGGSQ
jgi:type II secretory pathway pseudopilin PulG